ncbi:MAG: class I mannose-6-phosphate isomerase [Actinomycetota bacterium]|nr:class I mannose-6-phosphate isomerase [Actinomycetota bacterium]
MSNMGMPINEIPGRKSNYDKRPYVPVGSSAECSIGWDNVIRQIKRTGARVVVIEAYAGVKQKDLEFVANGLLPDVAIDASEALKPQSQIEAMLGPELTDDRVFGSITRFGLEDMFEGSRLAEMARRVSDTRGTVVVYGVGASLIVRGDLLVYADMPRWETQLRQRRNEVANIGSSNFNDPSSLQYKRSFFVDWRMCDRLKKELLPKIDLVLDTTVDSQPKMISGKVLTRALSSVAKRPFRVVPYFDPAPWGGEWIRTVCDLDKETVNYGWCFDCVPEENSLLLGFGDQRFEIPASDLVFMEPKDLLGQSVFDRFGDEFPIRFDFLDTMRGGNLSLQVHPSTAYIKDHFGIDYTQDESYYLLDAGASASVYLGLKEDVDREAMARDLRLAEGGGFSFPTENYINRFPAKKHDHFLIPAGTVHCSGAESMVLEISATPYIFTFKLWDWDRLGLDGRPRPIHLDHGLANIDWDRDTRYAKRELINQVIQVAEGEGWIEERTGLHEAEFIDTRRHWFTGTAPHNKGSGVNVLNLVEGEEAIVESPEGAFEPFEVHYAETFIVPAAVGPFQITSQRNTRCATIKASVRCEP